MKKVFVADFGAGNTSIYSVIVDGDAIPDPKPVIDYNVVPSGYYITNDSVWHTGYELQTLTWSRLNSITNLHINIKAIPNGNNDSELTAYFKAWIDKIRRQRPEEFNGYEEIYWMIGCPTGDEWKTADVRNKFRDIFVKAGFGKAENVMIISESNAALAYYQKTQKVLDSLDKDAGLLLVDQGAYSLDATYFCDGKITSVGSYLGASIVERMMVQMILYISEEKYRMNRREHNLPETIGHVKKMYEASGEKGEIFRTYLLLNARWLKEDYFNQLRNGTLSNTRDLVREVEIGDDSEPLMLYTNRRMMQDILEEFSVKSVLENNYKFLAEEVRDELGNNTWLQTFNSFLNRIDEKFPEFFRECKKTSSQSKKPVILLTGGGSLMGCIKESIEHHYPNASVHNDYEAVSAIGKGMAYWAPDKINAQSFDEAFSEFIDKEVEDEEGDKVNLFIKYFGDAFDECLTGIIPDLISEEKDAFIHGITEWKNYQCSSGSISAKIVTHINNWIKRDGIPKMTKGIDDQIEKLKKHVNEEFSSIMNHYGLTGEELLKPDDNIFLSDSKKCLPGVFEVTGELITDHYRNFKFSEYFPDFSKGILSDKRNDFYNNSVDSLNELLKQETDSTLQLLLDVFIRKEIREVGDEEYTFKQYFVLEGVFDMSNLIKERKKQLLGKLVLEEYIAEE